MLRALPRMLPALALAATPCLTACEPPATEDLLKITFGEGDLGPPVEADLDCSGGCGGHTELEAQLTFERGDLVPESAAVEVRQFRIDYTLPGADTGTVPFLADVLDLEVPLGGTGSFRVPVATDLQRRRVRDLLGNGPVTGTATLSLAGYDHRNAIVLPTSDPFPITFSDLPAPSSD